MEKTLREKIIEKVNILDVYPYSSTLKNDRGVCELKGQNTYSPSFVVYDNSSWNCFSCGRGGSVIDLYSHLHNISYRDSILELAREYKIEISEEEKEKLSKLEEIKKCFDYFTTICHKNLKQSEYYEKIKEKRKFSDALMNEYRIGLFDESIKNEMERKFDKQLLFDAGILNDKANWYFGKRIVFPYLNLRKEPVYFIFRKIDDSPDFMEAKYVKLHKTSFVQEELFGIDSTAKFRDKPLIITEGITDALSIIDCEYPCISPVTIKFKNMDTSNILNYAKHFEKVIIINDTDLNEKGQEGAEKSLQLLLKNNINAFVLLIPNPENRESVDLNDYISEFGKDKFEELLKTAKEGFSYFLDNINKDSKQEEIIFALSLIPEKDIKKKSDVFATITEKTNKRMGVRGLNALYKMVKDQEKQKEKQEEKSYDEMFGVERDKTLIFKTRINNIVIENRTTGVFKITEGKEYDKNEQIIKHPIILISKMKHHLNEYFTYDFKGERHVTETISTMISCIKNYVVGGETTKELIRILIDDQGKELPEKKCKVILGFDNGWILPFIESDYSILTITDFQRDVYEKANKLLTENVFSFEEIREKLIRFIDSIQMRKDKLVMIVGWAMASVFKLPILEYFNLFPMLLLTGDPQAGKTYAVKPFVVDFYRIWTNYFIGSGLGTAARLEDILSTSTFPIQIDELKEVKDVLIEILKGTLTGIQEFMRKLNVIEGFRKPEVVPFAITTNDPPTQFLDPALNSRIITIDYDKYEKITEEYEWVELYDEIKRINLFYYLYKLTEKWDNAMVINLIKIIEKDCPHFSDDSRLRKKYIIIMLGLHIFRLTFNIDLIDYLNLELFKESGKIMSLSLLDQFKFFCKRAMEFRDEFVEKYTDAQGNERTSVVRGSGTSFITCKLEKYEFADGKYYVFTQDHLRDFNTYAQPSQKYKMRPLVTMLLDALDDKTIIQYDTYRYKGKSERVVRINIKWLE